jgi:hypothetical protein
MGQWGGFLLLTQSNPDLATVEPVGQDFGPSFGSPQFNMVQAITGLDASATIGTVVIYPNYDLSLTGLDASVSFGTVTIYTQTNVAITGLDASASFGTPDADYILPITGFDAGPGFGALQTAVQYSSKIDERIFFWKL